MFGALKRGRFRSLASLIFVVNVVNVGELRRKRTLAASRGFLAAARLSCFTFQSPILKFPDMVQENFYLNFIYFFAIMHIP